MKIYSKILLIALPLIVLPALLVGLVSYRISEGAIHTIVQSVLELRLASAIEISTENMDVLREFGLETVTANVKNAQDATASSILDIRFEETGYVFVIDSDGIVRVHPDINLLGVNVSNQSWFEQLVGENSGSLRYIWQEESRWAAYDYFEDWDWYIISTSATSELLGSINQLGGYTLGLLAVGLIVATALLLFFARRLTSPITALTASAQAIADGNFEKQVDVQGSDEIAVLGNTFNQMTKQLASNIQKLDNNIQKLDKTNQDLGIQTAMAREAARLKSEFLATMSHELRTPLNAITGFTGILLFDEEEMDEDNVHMLQRVEANARRLLTLIDDVLDLSKIEAGRVEIVDEPIQIRSLVDQWLGETSVLAENKNLPLYTEISPAFPETIYGDSARLTQIAQNLLSNAIKFTSEGSVSLQVTAIDDYWHIIVKDTGIGIPPHARNYIFDEFRQVDGTSRRVYGGTGLGLAITRNLVLMMHGTVTVDSELGQGSTFTVRIPLRLVSLGEVEPMLIPS